MKADSTRTGEFSRPFPFNNAFSIIRLNQREKARQKTYEEAGAEPSSAYQDYESKRLENDWIARLRKRFPVVENAEALKSAFAPGTR